MASKAKQRRRKRQATAASAKRRTQGQGTAAEELRELASRNPLVLAAEDLDAGKGEFHARVRISTRDMTRAATGLPISADHEDVELWFGDTYPNEPPIVRVRHERFVGYPHVLVGYILCIYLDTDREWHPALGVSGVVTRLIEWLEDAAADRFDSRTALYHPIGGLPPSPRVQGVLVVRISGPDPPRKPISRAALDHRTSHRTDLVGWTSKTGNEPPSMTSALVLRTKHPMPFGLVETRTFGDLLARVAAAGGPRPIAALGAAERLLPHITDQAFRVILEVAHPTDQTLTYLACAIANVPPMVDTVTFANQLQELPIGWITVSDERTEVGTRRDHRRPTSALADKSIELWGCGGLGSWMAEFIVRAGARRLVLRDTGAVTGGLLVRQNYGEADIGLAKAQQLATRLRGISDEVDVVAESSDAVNALASGYAPSTDLLIDATINVTVAARLDEWARAAIERPLMAQVSTDPRSATLGMLVVADPTAGIGPATIDDATWASIHNDSSLERFHGFWTPANRADQVVPALGCSTPTFHGSAADLACLAGSFVNLLASHVGIATSGTHLVESSHARRDVGGGHRFVAYKPS